MLVSQIYFYKSRSMCENVTKLYSFYGILRTITPVESKRGSAITCTDALRDSMLPVPSPTDIFNSRSALVVVASAIVGVLLSCDRWQRNTY